MGLLFNAAVNLNGVGSLSSRQNAPGDCLPAGRRQAGLNYTDSDEELRMDITIHENNQKF
jgi:hypothetical protein